MTTTNQEPLSNSSLSSSVDELVRIEKVKLLYSNIPINIFASLAGAGLFAFTQSHFTDYGLLINWILCLFAMAFIRIGIFFAYKITPNPDKPIWKTVYTTTVLITAIIWACAIFFLTAEDSLISFLLLATVMMAVAAGSVSTLSYSRISGMGFLSVIMVPLIIWTYTRENDYSFYMSLIFSMFYLTLLITSLRFNRYITKGLTLNYQSMSDAIKVKAAKEQLELANTAKSTFLSSMSHELRTPLNAIMGFAQIMQMDNEKTLTSKQSHNLNEIMSASEHLLSLISGILDLSSFESGNLDATPVNVNVDDIINDTVPLVFHLTQKKKINISMPCDLKSINVFADPALLKKVLFNILCNAVKFNYENGSIIITAEELDHHVCIHITDTGKGIDTKDMKQLFKPFSRLDMKNNVTGVGIGLALSKRMLDVMNGSITVKSTPEVGSCFTITLPAAS